MSRTSKPWIGCDTRIALAGIAFIIVTAWSLPHARIDWPEIHGDHGAVRSPTPATLALELPHGAAEFELLTGSKQQRDNVFRAMSADIYFICAYTFFFFVLASTIPNERSRNVICFLILLAAVLDFTENYAILAALRQTPTYDAPALRAILTDSTLKWLLLFSVIAGMSIELGRRQRIFERVSALALRTAGAAGLFAAPMSFLSPSARPIIYVAMLLTSAGILVLIGGSTVDVFRHRRRAFDAGHSAA